MLNRHNQPKWRPPHPPKTEHPLTKVSGVKTTVELPFRPPPNDPLRGGWKELERTEENGQICRNYVEQLNSAEMKRYRPRSRKECKSKIDSYVTDDVFNFKQTRELQEQADQGFWMGAAEVPRAYEKWGPDACEAANKGWAGTYTWWSDNDGDLPTRVVGGRDTQGMMGRPRKIPWKQNAAEKMGPAAYSLDYVWNNNTQKCQRTIKASGWLKEALSCTGNLGSQCDLGYTAASEITKMYKDYTNKVVETKTRSQALEDFFSVANPLIKENAEAAKQCNYDGWWDRKMCASDKVWDNLPLLIVGGIVVAYIVLS